MGASFQMTLQLDQKTAQGFKEKFFYTDFGAKKGICSVLGEYGDESDFAKLFGAIKRINDTGCPVDAVSKFYFIRWMIRSAS